MPLVFLPGLLGTADIFAPQAEAFASRDPILVPRLTGGRTVEDIAAHLLDCLPERFDLAAISMGGYVALEILRRSLWRVSRLALINTSARADTPEQSAHRRTGLEQARHSEFSAFSEARLLQVLHPANRDDPRLLAIVRRMADAVTFDGYEANVAAAITRADYRPILPTILLPTLVVVGDADTVTPPDHAREIAQAIPSADLVVIADAGHAPTVEQPTQVNAALYHWLQRPAG